MQHIKLGTSYMHFLHWPHKFLQTALHSYICSEILFSYIYMYMLRFDVKPSFLYPTNVYCVSNHSVITLTMQVIKDLQSICCRNEIAVPI